MAIVKMKKIRLLTVRSQTDDLLRELMLLGCVEVSDPAPLLEDEEISALVTRESGFLSKHKAEHAELLVGIDLLTKYAPVKSKLLAPKPEVSQSDFLDETEVEDMLELSRRLERMDDQIKRAVAEESRLRSQIESLRPWEELEIPVEYSGTSHMAVFTGVVPAICSLDALKADAYSISDEVEITVLAADNVQQYLLVFCFRDILPQILTSLRKFGYSSSALGGYTGTVKENIKALENRLAEIVKEKEETSASITAEGQHRDSVKLCADRIQTKIAKAEVLDRLLTTGSAVYCNGWFPVPAESAVVDVLGKFDCAWEIEDPNEDDIPDVPILLKSGALTSPLTVVTEMYSMPAYDGIDPNPLMMPFFTMFFGIMSADIGYGLILSIACHVILKKTKPRKGTMKYMLELLRMCGISAIFWGAMTGGFFGDVIPVVAGMYGRDINLPYLFSPLDDPILLLGGAIVVGAIQIITGLAISAYMSIRDHDWMGAFVGVFAWYTIFVGIAVGATGGTWYIAIAGAAIVVLFEARDNPNFVGRIVSGIGKLYDISAYLGDILSYSRLMTMMLAGGIISSVFNKIGAITGNMFLFIPIFLIGHSMNIFTGFIGAFVHTMRLQYLEYFGKFYKDGGKAFKPLELSTKYVDIIKEEK